MLIYLFFAHFIADFLLQSRQMGVKKSSEPIWLLAHCCVIHVALFLFAVAFISPLNALYLALMNSIVHAIIDGSSWNLYKLSVRLRDKKADPKTWKYYDDHWFYVTVGLDQMAHYSVLAWSYFLFWN